MSVAPLRARHLLCLDLRSRPHLPLSSSGSVSVFCSFSPGPTSHSFHPSCAQHQAPCSSSSPPGFSLATLPNHRHLWTSSPTARPDPAQSSPAKPAPPRRHITPNRSGTNPAHPIPSPPASTRSPPPPSSTPTPRPSAPSARPTPATQPGPLAPGPRSSSPALAISHWARPAFPSSCEPAPPATPSPEGARRKPDSEQGHGRGQEPDQEQLQQQQQQYQPEHEHGRGDGEIKVQPHTQTPLLIQHQPPNQGQPPRDRPASDPQSARTFGTTSPGALNARAPNSFEDWSTSFRGFSSIPFDKKAQEILLEPIKPEDVEIKHEGILYLPEIKYRRILNRAFGPGGWGLAPRGRTLVTPKLVTREYGLVIHGRLVSISRGEQQYFEVDGIPTATEGCKSNALMRCCKDLGIASELWDPVFIRGFLARHTKQVWVEHQVSKKRRMMTVKLGTRVTYPYREIAAGGGPASGAP